MIEQEVLLTNPFPGLRPFRMEENEFFFGRDGQSDQVLTKLRTARFVAVVGTSGSGKSSLVNAGLLPALFSGHLPSAGSSWRVASFRPGSSPISNLAEALNAPNVCGVKDKDVSGERLANIERTLRRSSLGLLEVVSQSKLRPGENLLILADQFEELFRFRKKSTAEHPKDEAAAFVKLLLETKQPEKSDEEKLPIYVILTMRSDYLGDCAHFWGLPEAINEGQYLIPRMTDDNRREAITGPIIIGGAEITAPLVNLLLNDAGDDPAQLPILQHALMRTWDYWKTKFHAQGPLDILHYRKIGGMKEALSKHADEAFLELSPELQLVAAKVFKALTEKEADRREGRRPATVNEIAVAAGSSEEQVRQVVEKFRSEGRSFLMPSPPAELASHTLIDISHESLIRGWDRLRIWVDQEAESARQYVRLADKAAFFPEGEDFLRDPALSAGLKWLEDNRPTKAWAERYHKGFDKTIEYLELSKKNRQDEIDRKEQQHKEEVERELRHAQALAAGEQRRVKLRNWGLVILSLLLLGMLGVTGYAVQQNRLAQQQTARANQQSFVALQQTMAATRAQAAELEQKLAAEHATVVAEEERDKARNAEKETAQQRDLAEHQRLEALKQAKIAEAAKVEADRQKGVAESALSEESLARVAAGRAEEAALREKAEAERQRDAASELLRTVNEIDRSAPYFAGIMRGHKQSVSSVWFAGNSDRVITQSAEGSKNWLPGVGLIDLANQPYLADRVTTPVLYNKAGTMALLRNHPGHNGTVVWDIPGRKELARLPWTDTAPQNTIISPDGRWVVHHDKANSKVGIYDIRSGQPVLEESGEDKLPALAFSDDGQFVAIVDGSKAGIAKVSRAEKGIILTGHLDEINSLAFSRDNKFVVTASKDGTARVWDAATGNTVQVLTVNQDSARTGQADQQARPAASAEPGDPAGGAAVRQTRGSVVPVTSAHFSDDDRYIVTTGGNSAYLWEAKPPGTWTAVTDSSPTTFLGHTDIVSDAAFSPDGKWVVTISQDRTAQLWDARVLTVPVLGVSVPMSAFSVAVFRGHIKPVTSVDISPDSKYVVTGSEDRTARVWDLRSFGAFNVAGAEVAATAPVYGGRCPANVKVTGRISVTGRSGNVEYKFVRSDGSESLPQVLTFDGPGSKEVSDTREVYTKGVSRSGNPLPVDGWVEIEILKPAPLKSNRASFTVTCGDLELRYLTRRDLSARELREIMPGSSEAQQALYLPHLQKAMDEFGINTPLRQAAFLAEVAYSTAQLTHLVELGSDAELERRYGSRKEFGNFEPGDGARYKGRGAFQLTGRAQYQAVGAQLGVDLIADPEKAAAPDVAFRTAALYWQKNGLNEKAEQALLPAIHLRVYGGRAVPPELQAIYDRAKRVLGAE